MNGIKRIGLALLLAGATTGYLQAANEAPENIHYKLMKKADAYAFFNLNVAATEREVKKAFHKMMLRVHPDKHDMTEAQKPNPGRRAQYTLKAYERLTKYKLIRDLPPKQDERNEQEEKKINKRYQF